MIMVTNKRVILVVAIGLPLFGSLGCGERPGAPLIKEKSNEPRFIGYLDGASGQQITGWVMDEANVDNAIMMSFYDGDTLLGAIKADVFRKDLRDKNIGSGKYGFLFPVPAKLLDGKTHRIQAKIQGTAIELRDSPKEIVFGTAKVP